MATGVADNVRVEFRVVQTLLNDGPRIRVVERARDRVHFDSHTAVPSAALKAHLGQDFRTVLLGEEQVKGLVDQIRQHSGSRYFDVEGFMRGLAAKQQHEAKA